jgi:hypothetical protein
MLAPHSDGENGEYADRRRAVATATPAAQLRQRLALQPLGFATSGRPGRAGRRLNYCQTCAAAAASVSCS